MEDWNDIVFLDSEIVEDDDDAPVGMLVEHGNTVPEVAEQKDNTVELTNEEPVLSQSQEEQEPANEEQPVDSEETVVEEQAKVTEETPAPIEDEKQVEEMDEQSQVEEPANEAIEDVVEEPVSTDKQVVEDKVEEPEMAVEDAKEVAKVEQTAEISNSTPQNDQEKSTSNIAISLKDSSSINDALFDTSFEIERPQKAKIVSTKKKQEKEQDLWSVAPIVQKKAVKHSTTDEKASQADEKKPAKRTTSKVTAEKVAADTQEKPTAKKKTTKQESAQTTATTKVDNKKTKAEENKKMAKETETAAKEIDWIQEPTEKYAGTYVIKKTDKGNFVFKLFAYNKNCLAIGAQPYTSIAGCKGGINSIIKNAATAPVANLTLKNPENTDKFPRWEIYEDKKGEFRLRLIASNGNLVATTNDGYMQASGAKKGIESIAKASVGCGIRRDDNLW